MKLTKRKLNKILKAKLLKPNGGRNSHNIKDLDDNDAKTLYEDLIELIELDWFNRSMQDNYIVYICEVERVLGSRGLL